MEGNMQFDDSQFDMALDSYQQALKIYRSIKDGKKEEVETLNGLGLTYNALGNHKQAIAYYKESRDIARKIGDREGEGESLHYTGIAFLRM